MKRLVLMMIVLVVLLVGCGSGTSSPAAPVSPTAKTYRSVLLQANVTTNLKHIIFFNTTSMLSGGKGLPKGTIISQAFVDDAILAVPIPQNGTDVIIADPVDSVLSTVIVQGSGYLVHDTITGVDTGPYTSAIIRDNAIKSVSVVKFYMLTGKMIAVAGIFNDILYFNMRDDGAILVPVDGTYPAGDIFSGHWGVDPISGKIMPVVP